MNQITHLPTAETEKVFAWTQEIVQQTGPRLTGDPSTKLAAELIQKDWGSFCASTAIDSFPVHPKAFLDWIRLLVGIYAISVVLIWLNGTWASWINALLITLGILIMVLQFFFYKEAVDLLFPKKVGYNVLGTIEPEGKVTQQIILSGHHDSAFVFNFFIHQPKLYSFRIYSGLGVIGISFFIYWIWAIWWSITKSVPPFALIWQIVSTIFFLFVAQLWFFRGNQGTPGVGDNLISVGILTQIGRYFTSLKHTPQALQHTRLILASWDAEEAGLRGARAFVEKNRENLKQIPTYNFNYDCPYQLKELFFLTSDVNGSVQLSPQMAAECVKIATDLGYAATAKPVAFMTGGSDAGEFGRVRIEATTLMAMPWGNNARAAAYHTPKDDITAIEPAAIEAALNITATYIIRKDQASK